MFRELARRFASSSQVSRLAGALLCLGSWYPTLESENDSRMGHPAVVVRGKGATADPSLRYKDDSAFLIGVSL